MNAKELIIKVCENHVDRPIKAGHNGPYKDPETLSRNLSHWLILYAKCFQWTSVEKFKSAVIKNADRLISKECLPYKKSFYHRNKEGKDKCNGLVGQAWSIEALIEASNLSNDPKYKEIAISVAENHKFNSDFNLWHILEIKGEILEIDPTFNHQLWFAASIAPLMKDSKVIETNVNLFLDHIKSNLTVLRGGLIYHPIDRNLADSKSGNNLKGNVSKLLKTIYLHPQQFKRRFSSETFHQSLRDKSIGYHLFNIYAFRFLELHVPDHSFFKSRNFKKMISYSLREDLYEKLISNKYAYPYNAPGFAMPFILSFSNDNLIELGNSYFRIQLEKTFNKTTYDFSNNTPDPATLTARLYELSRAKQEYLEKLQIDEK